MMNGIKTKGPSPRAIIALLVIVIAAAGGGWYVIQRNDRNSTNSSSTQNANQATSEKPEIKKGAFVGVSPKTGSGSVTLVRDKNNTTVVRLEDDFKVQEGPDLFVGFGNNNTLDHDTLFAELKSFEGRQEYQVPATLDVSKYTQVFIYCREFSVDFSVATLQLPSLVCCGKIAANTNITTRTTSLSGV